MKQVIFDIGANTGEQLIVNAKKYPQSQFYAFEPVPQLFDRLVKLTEDLPNVVLVKKAVSNFNGKAEFNIANELDNHTTSSLLEFIDDVTVNWKGVEKYMTFIDKIEVDVIRLEDFVDSFGITKIDYLHCDAQGSDLKVLEGLGDKIKIVQEGCVEAGIKFNALYKNQCMIDQVQKYLEKNNFEILAIRPNDAFGNEANMFFKNKGAE
jgi:FkbM family methyltransferase